MTRTLQTSMSSICQVARAAVPLVLMMLSASVAAACPTCGDGIGQSDPQGQSLAAGFYYSILFMMSMPYLVLTTLGCIAYVSIRRARLASADGVAGVEACGELDSTALAEVSRAAPPRPQSVE